MANNLSFIDMVSSEALKVLHEKPSFINTIDKQYDTSFDGSIGNQLRVKKARRFEAFEGRVMQQQDIEDIEGTIVQATQYHVPMKFNAIELTLDTSNPKQVAKFAKDNIIPAMSQLTAKIEQIGIEQCTKAVAQTVGTAGTAITDLTVPGLARARLNRSLAPSDQRIAMIDSITMSQIVNGRASYFNPTPDISKNYREGSIGRNGMADWYENEKAWTLTNGSDVTISTDAAALVVHGTGALDFHTLTASQVAVGSVFTISGCYDCHPETKQPFGNLKQFTLVSGGATTGASVVSPKIYLTGPYRNVGSAAGAELTAADFNAKAMTFVGSASTSYVQGLMYHPSAFQFVNAKLAPITMNPNESSQKTHDGLSITATMMGDITNYELMIRLDVLCGFAALQPEFACRLIGSAAS